MTSNLAPRGKETADGRVSDLTAEDIKPLSEPIYTETMRNGRVKLDFVAVMEEIGKRGLYRVTMDGKVIVPSSTNPELHTCRVLNRLGFGGIIGFRRPWRAQIDSIVLDIATMAKGG